MANYLGRREKGVRKIREKGDENLGDMGPNIRVTQKYEIFSVYLLLATEKTIVLGIARYKEPHTLYLPSPQLASN